MNIGDDFLNKFKIFLILVILFASITAVSAEGNYSSLYNVIDSSQNSCELTQDYAYNDTTDDDLKSGIMIQKDNFVLNGNGHTIDAANQSRVFSISGNNVTLKNLKIINGNMKNGGAVENDSMTIFENITFIGNTAKEEGSAIFCGNANVINCTFINNHASEGIIFAESGNLTIKGSTFTNTTNLTFSIIHATSPGNLNIEDCIFSNSKSKYATAIYTSRKLNINGSLFENLSADMTGGAIVLKGNYTSVIKNTQFRNTKANKNGGAIYVDFQKNTEGLELKNTTFINSSAEFGGAICQLEGYMMIEDSTFSKNTATYSGGAIYGSYANLVLTDSEINSNKVTSGDTTTAGGIYLDNAYETRISNNIIANNTKHGIYSYESNLNVSNTTFEGNGKTIHSIFTKNNITNLILKNDTLNLNDTDYISIIEENVAKFELINNSITIKDLPVRFDSRDWGWVTPVKDQGIMGACWTFSVCGALESALLKATGITYNLSENNMQNIMLKFSKYGISNFDEGGVDKAGLSYALSWLGVLPAEYDTYDELGKISQVINTNEKIHITDAIIVPKRDNLTDNAKLKKAIMLCGGVASALTIVGIPDGINPETESFYQNESQYTNHEVTFVGWDDNYSAKKFKITPPGDGAFIIKNSWGTDYGDNGYYYVSYYDTSLLTSNVGIGFVIENTENYTKNYQTDISGNFESPNFTITEYKTTYTSQGNDLVSAVGTYYTENENYTLELYVNDKLVHTQNGTSTFYGFHTVKLTKEIPVKKNDTITVLMKKTSCFTIIDSRQHYLKNVTFVKVNGTWNDITKEDKTVSLKVYTKDLPIYSKDLVKFYKNDSQFEVNVVVKGIKK